MVKTTSLNGYALLDHGVDDFHALEQHWRTLERGEDMTAFQSFDWYQSLHGLYHRERTKNLFRRWRFILVMRGDVPVMIAPLEIKPVGIGYKNLGARRGVYFIGRIGYTDYLNFIYDHFQAEALQTVLDYVGSRYKHSRFLFERMLESSSSFRYLQGRFDTQTIPQNCAAIVLPECFETYRQSLSKSARQNIRTAVNRAKKNGLELTHELIFDGSPELKEQIIALNRQRLKKKTARSRKEMSFAGAVYCFFADLLRKIFSAPMDVVRSSKRTFSFIVKDGEKLVSFFWGIRNDYLKEFYVILVGVDQEYEWYSPNISHLYLFLEECYEKGDVDIRLLDFTRGAEGYKKTIGCVERPTSGLMFKRNRRR